MGLFSYIKKPITRRKAIQGTAAAGFAVAVTSMLSACGRKSGTNASGYTSNADANSTDILKSFKQVDFDYKENNRWKLDLGTVLKPSQNNWVAGLVPGDSPSVMVKAIALSSSNGKTYGVVKSCVTPEMNWVIFDASCSDSVYAWVELSMVDHSWKLYGAPFSAGKLGQTTKLWESDKEFDPPYIGCWENTVIWSIMPNVTGHKTAETSHIYQWKIGNSKANSIFESKGRFACPFSISKSTITIAPRVPGTKGSLNYEIQAYDIESGFSKQLASLALPDGVKPMFAQYLNNRLVFSIEANYSKSGLLGQMGTYISADKEGYIYLSREPFSEVYASSRDVYVIKSRSSYFVVNIKDQSYSILQSLDRCVDYGEYPAIVGESNTFMTFSAIKSEETGYPSQVIVRTFAI